MVEYSVATDRLESWKEIADYVRRTVRTVIRWEKEAGFPVHRVPVGTRRTVYAYKHEIDSWMGASETRHEIVASGEETENEWSRPSADSTSALLPLLPDAKPREKFTGEIVPGGLSRWTQVWLVVVCLIGAIIIVGALWPPITSSSSPRLANMQQLTFNGMDKDGLQTDGQQIYFGQYQNGWMALAAIPVDGGSVRIVWNPPASVLPVDILPDRKSLLVLTYKNIEREKEIWVVSLNGGNPHRLGSVVGHSAVWSPDGRFVAFAFGERIYLVNSDGSSRREIGSFAKVPDMLHWSMDGKRLRFSLMDEATRTTSFWELDLSGQLEMSSLHALSLPVRVDADGGWARASGQDAFFYTGNHTPGSSRIWLVRYGRHWWQSQVQMQAIRSEFIGSIAYVVATKRLYVTGGFTGKSRMEAFSPQTGEFRYILPGASGDFVEFSRDALRAVWVGTDDDSLWTSRADGSEMKRLVPMDHVELPRWSPNGKQIAFMLEKPNAPWRIYIAQADSGEIREASEGDDNQGAPTWSPDGRFLVYGRVKCEASDSCEIRRIDLATGKVQTLPGSQGLVTARWSPDGKYIAALQPLLHQVLLYDLNHGRWRKLADSIDGADLSWSANSGHVYASTLGNRARIVRISAATGVVENVLDLHATDEFSKRTSHDAVFSLGQNDEIILSGTSPSSEIFAFDVENQ